MSEIQRRSGFTLVEVMATLVLLGIIVPVAMRIMAKDVASSLARQ